MTPLLKRLKTRVKPFVIVLAGRAGAGLLLINLLVIFLAGLSLHDSFRQYHERAAITTQNLATVLALEIQNEIDSVDLALRTIADEAQRQMAIGGIDTDKFTVFLERQQELHPQVGRFQMASPEGVVAYTGGGASPVPPIAVADRDYFIASRDQSEGLKISHPLLGRIGNRWMLAFARRLSRPDGSFGGVVFAPLAEEHFVTVFSRLDLGRNGAVTLRNGDLNLIARFPTGTEGEHGDKAKTTSMALRDAVIAQPRGGIFDAVVALDGVERMNAYRRVGDYPLYIVVGLSTQELLAEWRQEAFKIVTVVVLFALMTLTGAWFMFAAWAERSSAHEQLQASKAELERFTEILAHHLQEPVRVQYSFAQRLKVLLPPPIAPELAETVNFILKGAARLRSLIRDAQLYLALNQEVTVQGRCLAALALDNALLRLQNKIVDTAATITQGPLPAVAMDEKRLSDVFTALLDNALEYHRPHLAPRIAIAAERQGDAVLMSVSDNGIGIPEAFHTRVFKVFERLNGGEHLGTGIGLAIAKKIIEAALGRIWIESPAEGGTRVCFTLPAADE